MQFVLSKAMVQATVSGLKLKGFYFSAVFSFLECLFGGHCGFTCKLYQVPQGPYSFCHAVAGLPFYLVPGSRI